MPISPWILVSMIALDVVFVMRSIPMSKQIRILFIIARIYYFLYYLMVSLEIVDNPFVMIALGRFAAFFLFLTEIVVYIAYKLGDKDASSK